MILKFIFGKLPSLRGRFPYFGSWVYFPLGSVAFSEACRQGIFELENVKLLINLTRPKSWMFDVGANIGLMSLPVLHEQLSCSVLSVEPSPNSASFLEKTIDKSPYRERWKLVRKAAGAVQGTTEFFVSQIQDSVYDLIVNTRRGNSGTIIKVEMTTLDDEWKRLNCPEVSVLKIDTEGWEVRVLEGASDLIQSKKPHILLEWQRTNLEAAGIANSVLFEIANKI